MIPTSTKIIYVAGPYKGDVEANIAKAEAASVELWRRGWVVICPHKNTAGFEKYEDASLPPEVWIQGDLVILSRCDAIFMLKDWQQSAGAKEERRFAIAREIPVLYEGDRLPNPWGLE